MAVAIFFVFELPQDVFFPKVALPVDLQELDLNQLKGLEVGNKLSNFPEVLALNMDNDVQ